MFSPALLAAIAIGTPDPDLHYKLKTNYLSRTLSPTCSVPRTVSSSLTLPQPHKIKLFGETRGKRYAMNRVGCAFSDNEAWTDGPFVRNGRDGSRRVLSSVHTTDVRCDVICIWRQITLNLFGFLITRHISCWLAPFITRLHIGFLRFCFYSKVTNGNANRIAF